MIQLNEQQRKAAEFEGKHLLVLGRSVWSLSKVEGACLSKKIPYMKFGGTLADAERPRA